jgi:hypothetical protein
MVERICSVQDCGRGGKLTRGMCTRCYRHWLDHTPAEDRGLAPRFSRNFWDSVTKTHEYGCWTWTGITDPKGYGRWGRKIASRHSWELANGAIPDGMWVLHHCDNKPCVNPRHLYLGTVIENTQDAMTRGKVPRVNAEKTHCPAGHPYAGVNLYVVKSGGRQCKECNRTRSRERQRRRRAALSGTR